MSHCSEIKKKKEKRINQFIIQIIQFDLRRKLLKKDECSREEASTV